MKYLLIAVKIVAPILLIVWLVSRLDPEQIQQLRERPLDWFCISGAFLLMLAINCASYVRWYLLVRALELPFLLRDAFRLGFLGYLFNFVSMGSMGGDPFKAVFIAREQPGRRMEAVATVVVDRIAGMYGLILVTSITMAVIGLPKSTPQLEALRQATFIVAGIGAAGLAFLLMPGTTDGPLIQRLTRVPKIGALAERVIAALQMYRRRWRLLLVAGLMSVAIHATIAIAVYFLARGIFAHPPTLSEQLLIVPMANIAGAIPGTPLGLGTFEFAMDMLYKLLPSGDMDASGVTVALAYRVLSIAMAGIAVVVYWFSRREMADVMEESRRVEAVP